jgi:hypothetical protein
MKTSILTLLTLFFLSINCTAQTSLIIDYTQAAATTNATLDFNTDVISIKNVPGNLPAPISINNQSGTIAISIDKNSLAGIYKPAVTTHGSINTITINLNNGQIQRPFPVSNAQAPLSIRFNGKTAIITRQQTQPANLPPQAPGLTQQLSGIEPYNPGNIYNDVVRLIQLKQTNDIASIKLILNAYGGINGNPFLTEVWASVYNSTVVQGGTAPSLSGAFSAAGNLNVTNIADGIAKFLVERSKEELTVSFFGKFQVFLNKYPELGVLFPTTAGFINSINDYQYNAMLPALRSAFQKDLNNITGNLISLGDLTTDKCSGDTACQKRITALNSFLNNSVNGRSIISALILVNGIIKGENPADAISNLASDPVCQASFNDNFYNIANAIQFTNLLSQSLISTETGRVWVRQQQINDLVNNETAFKTYLGLLYAKNIKSSAPVTFNINGDTISLKTSLDIVQKNWLSLGGDFKIKFRIMANAVSSVADEAQTIAAAATQGDPNNILAYANYASSLANEVTQVINFLADKNGLSPKLSTLKTDAAMLNSALSDATNIIYDIKSQNYGSLVMNSSNLLVGVFQNKFTFKDDFITYGTFMANIVQAKTSDEVKAAIDATVLPIGSASIKRNTQMNIALNAYIGATAGREFLATLPKGKQWGGVAGVTAPVGVAFSWGNIGYKATDANGKPLPADKTVGGKSFSVFISLIDVGALAAYRLQNDGSSVAPEVQLKNIVAPGLSFYWGLGKTPVSLGLGAQFGPQLRNVTAADVNQQQNYYLRVAASIVVDIPLFNFYTRSR